MIVNSISRISKLLTISVLLLTVSACSTIQTTNGPGTQAGTESAGGLKTFKRAYVEALNEDEFQIYTALVSELTDMGFEVTGLPFKDTTETDLLVKYSYDSGWDMTRYLQSFQIRFINAKAGKLVAITSYKSRGLWMGVRDTRLEAAFNDLRAKNGYSPSTQFNAKK